ncbi:urea transporter [Rummeliibacillus sp. JY-2-4R]
METDKQHSLRNGPIFSFITATLTGISQVILIENVITGLLILIAIAISSIYLGLIALFSSIMGVFVGKIGGADPHNINQGLLGYNSVLTGLALALFLHGPFTWIAALVGAAVAAVFTATMMHFMKNTEIPLLTFPFIILTWFILLSTYKLERFQLSKALVPQDLTNFELDIEGKVDLLSAIFHGIGQVFFLDNTLSGILIFIAVFWGGWRIGLYAAIGNAVAIVIAYLLGGEHELIVTGLYGYNAILTIIAVSAVFKHHYNRLSLLTGIIAACLSVPITAGLSTALLPLGLPALTMPFVLCTWLFLGARNVLPNI